jgi:hypothetical protein
MRKLVPTAFAASYQVIKMKRTQSVILFIVNVYRGCEWHFVDVKTAKYCLCRLSRCLPGTFRKVIFRLTAHNQITAV